MEWDIAGDKKTATTSSMLDADLLLKSILEDKVINGKTDPAEAEKTYGEKNLLGIIK